MPLVIHIQETDSTNNYIKKLLSAQQIEEGTIVYTDFQTAGKGQRGNAWEAERGMNLTFSIIFYPNTLEANEQFVISQIVSLAVVDVLNKYTDGISIKWPNDIYWKERKICGILIENSLDGDTIKESVCGIGVNINQAIFKSNAPNPVSLKQITGKDFDLEVMLHDLQQSILYYYTIMTSGDANAIVARYKANLFRKDGYHLFNDGSSDFPARIKDVESDGMLVLETKERQEKRYAFKEVRYILT